MRKINEQVEQNKHTAEEWIEDKQLEKWLVRKLLAVLSAVLLAGIILIIIAIAFIAFEKAYSKTDMIAILNGKAYKGNIIFAETHQGSLTYIPINEKEAVMETSSDTGKSLYLWLETGQTITITDDVIVTEQANLFDMLKAVIFKSRLIDIKIKNGKNSLFGRDDTYIFYVNGVENISELMTKDWCLPEDQATDSLTCYDESLNKDINMELIIETKDKDVFFELSLLVDDISYCIYSGRFLKQDQTHLPQFEVDLYNLNSINTAQHDQQIVDAYIEKANEYFNKLSTFLIIEDFEQVSNIE